MENRRKFISHVAQNSPNPCRRECIPFSEEYCILNETYLTPIDRLVSVAERIDDKYALQTVANAMCRLVKETQNLTYHYHESSDAAHFWKSVAESVTKDKITGLLTGNGLEAILEEIYDPQNIKNLVNKNYHAQIIYIDINNLRIHNGGPGGHAQGDMAIREVGAKIREFTETDRRSKGVISLKEDQDDYDRRKEIKIPRVIAARSNERGDEFLIITLDSQKNPKKLQYNKEKLTKLFCSMGYEYEGVDYPVSATFGMTEIPLPIKIEDLKESIKKVDVEMMIHKKQHKSLSKKSSSGVVVDI